jgi:hypothetical protein
MTINLPIPIWDIEHVAKAFIVEVDTAREYTYRVNFRHSPTVLEERRGGA